MRHGLEILVVGRSREELGRLQELLQEQGDVNVTTRYVSNGHTDPLHDVESVPDALILMVSGNWEAELSALTDRPSTERPPLLVIGDKANVDLIRCAMRAGARDFFSPPILDDEIKAFLHQIRRERETKSVGRTGHLTAVINAKGGSGASVIAANLAHILAVTSDRRTVLVDMDIQFGALPLYFNLTPRNGLVRALELVETLDPVALEGYVQSHQSGLDVLASLPEDLASPSEIPESRMETLLGVLGRTYDNVIVDLPRWIGGSTGVVLERADRIYVVLQQGIAHLRDAKRLTGMLRREINISEARITVVLNRYDKRNAVTLRDIQEGLPKHEVVTLPNDFRTVAESVNAGTPLLDLARKAPVTRGLVTLSEGLNEYAGSGSRKRGGWSLFGRGPRAN